jgi:hypothetical protein
MHHPTNSISTFTRLSFHFHTGRQPPSHRRASTPILSDLERGIYSASPFHPPAR